MLGKTHVSSSLAVVGTGVAAYSAYTMNAINKGKIAQGGTFDLLDVTIGAPMSVVELSVVIVTMMAFIMVLFGAKSLKTRAATIAIIGAVFAGMWFIFNMTYPMRVIMLLMCFIIGVLLPDIDSEKSTLGKMVPFIGAILPHRLVTHTIWMFIPLIGFTWVFKSAYLLALTLGFFTHISQDTLSAQGICWFYPVVGKYKSFTGGATIKEGKRIFPTYSVGGAGETFIHIISICTLLTSVVVLYYVIIAM